MNDDDENQPSVGLAEFIHTSPARVRVRKESPQNKRTVFNRGN
jgi:hypothetical protein